MKKIQIAFVILHYLTINDTIEAVNSIKSLNSNEPYVIVIVDNGSNNGSYEMLMQIYGKEQNIFIVHSNINLGFAKGNNLGIKYCRDNFEFDFIAVINNDIICIQKDMIVHIVEDYKIHEFDVLGPLVLTADGRYDCSPVRSLPMTLDDIKKNYAKEKKLYIVEKYRLMPFLKFCLYIKRRVLKIQKSTDQLPAIEYKRNIIPHGCFIIFSNNFFKKCDGFCSRTFLYHEEELLGLSIQSHQLVSLFTPNVYVYHKEDSSSKASISGTHRRRLFTIRECMKSSKILIEEYKKYN